MEIQTKSRNDFYSFKWINLLDAAINYTFIVRRLDTAQHVLGIFMPIIRSLSTAVAASGLPLERGGSSVVGRGRSGRTDHDQQHCYYHVPTVNQRRLLQLISSWGWAWGCPKHVEQCLNNKRFYNWVCIWLVVLFEDLKMHGTTNHKLNKNYGK
jgi:hypothetical protein